MVNKITTPPTQNEVIDKINELVDGKQDTISDLATIRSGATGNVKLNGGSSTQTISLTSGTGTTALGVKSKSGTSYISFSGSSGWLASFGIGSDKKPTIYDGSSHTIAYTSDIPTVNNASLTIQKNGTNVATFTANASSNVTANISVPNTVSSVSSSSTNADAVGAKLFYDTVGDIETALHTINSGGSTVTVSIYATGSTISAATVTIGNETFTNLVAETTYTFEANKNESYTLRLQRSGRAVAIRDSNDNVLVGYPNTYSDDVSYTFTATSDVTYRVYSGSEKV